MAQITVLPRQKDNNIHAHLIGFVNHGGIMNCRLTYLAYGRDTSYTLTFRNAKYQIVLDYQSIDFDSDGKTLESFYNILKSFFSDEHKKDKEYKVQFLLGKELITATNDRTLGMNYLTIFTNKGYFDLSDKMLDKLFGEN